MTQIDGTLCIKSIIIQGELNEISTEENENISSRRTTPLKSLLKKQSFDADDFACETISLPGMAPYRLTSQKIFCPELVISEFI